MPLQKIAFKPGVNRENTRYTTEGGWYECDKIRFRSGFPEKIGGWERYPNEEFLGVCRSLFNWVTADGNNLLSIATNVKVYVEAGQTLFDVTPVRSQTTILTTTGVAGTTGLGSVTVSIT